MRRKPQFESLDQRLCFAFGDVDQGFAKVGEYSVSYDELDRVSSSIVQAFSSSSGYLVVANTRSGSGSLFTLAKYDRTGAADPNFGTGGLVQFIDPAVPLSGASHAVQLSDGRMVLRTNTGSDYMSFIGVRADGLIDTSFGDSGYVRRGEVTLSDFAMIADNAGGFLTVENNPRTFQGQVRRYTGSGQLDTTFGQGGVISLSTRLTTTAIAINNTGVITIVGYDTLDNLRMKSYRFSASGVADTTFGTGGISTGSSEFSLLPINLARDGQSFTLLSYRVENDKQIFNMRRYGADTNQDLTFGSSGVASFEYKRLSVNITGNATVFTDSDGSYRVAVDDSTFFPAASKLTTYKLLSNGSLDSNFGTAGKSEVVNSANVFLASKQSDIDGGVLWFGSVQPLPNANFVSDSILYRTNAAGQLDKNWDEDGVKPLYFTPASQTIDWMQLDPLAQGGMRLLSGWPTFNAPKPNIGRAETLNAQGELIASSSFGRIVSKQNTVTSPSADGGWFIAQFLNDGGVNRIEITKFFATGGQDLNFGTSGVMTVATDSLWNIFMRTSRDGSVVVAGSALADQSDPASSPGVAVIVRLNANGTPMQSFGAGGVKRIYSKSGNLADVLVDPNLGVVMVYDPYFDLGVIMQRYSDTGVLDTRFDMTGVLANLDVAAAEVDETGRILIVAHGFETFLPYQLYQLGADGQLITSFGTGGHVDLPITRQPELASVRMSVRQGVISIASAHTRDATVVRLLAYDYAGKPLTELDTDGIRDYDLSPDGEQVADLQFSDDGMLWLATMNREKFDLFGKVIRLAGSSTPTFHNWSVPLDVSLDGRVTAFDALIVISALNGIASPIGTRPDTNADTRLTALDALLIINRLNVQGAEGESQLAEDQQVEMISVSPVSTSPVPHDVVMDTYGEWEVSAKRRKG